MIFADVGTHCDDHYSIAGGTPGLAMLARDALAGLIGTRLVIPTPAAGRGTNPSTAGLAGWAMSSDAP